MTAHKERIVTRRLDFAPHFHQTDMMGMVHNAVYFHWFEEGRLQIMNSLLSFEEALELRVVTPVVENHCVYKKPARFGDHLTLLTSHRIVPAYEGRLHFDHVLTNRTTKAELATGHTVITLVDLSTEQLIKEWNKDLWERYQALDQVVGADAPAGKPRR
jgi:acyl-CoA thioester hydrolase